MNMSPKAILISIAAGLASALCVMASFGVSASASPLMLLAAFPIYLATLSQGTAVGVGSSILAIMIAATAINPQAAIMLGIAFTIPASIIGNQANLAQETDGEMEWYPLSKLFFNLCIIISLGISILMVMSGFDAALLTSEFTQAFKNALEANPRPQPISDAELEQFIALAIKMSPFILGGLLLVVHVASVHLAAVICRASNMMPRPKDDIAGTVNLPKIALAIMLGSLLLSLAFTGIIQVVMMIITGVFIMAFTLIGLAIFHQKLHNKPAAGLFLTLTYIVIFITYPLFHLFSIGGILRSFNQSNNQTNTPPKAG